MVGHQIWRGHGRLDWRLSSHWERWLLAKKPRPAANVMEFFESRKAYEAIRDGRLASFKKLSAQAPGTGNASLSDTEWWALGRHHGLVTPLLDWTESPYVAAFFAFADYVEVLNPGAKNGTHLGGYRLGSEGFDHIAVWCFSWRPEHLVEGEFGIVSEARPFSDRQRAQRSLFTRLAHDCHQDLESYLASRRLEGRLTRYEVCAAEAFTALRDLQMMNITYGALFPDLDGAAWQANIGTLWEVAGRHG